MDKRSASAGFTLVELMVVVALAALLQSLAVPAFRGFVNSMRLTAAVNSLFTSLLLARSEASSATAAPWCVKRLLAKLA